MHRAWNLMKGPQLYEEAVRLHKSSTKNTPCTPSTLFQEAIVQTTIGEIDFLANTLKFRVIKFVYDGQRFAGKAEEKEARMKKMQGCISGSHYCGRR
jgi:hypothetical protein